jgi:hypothetical protein
VGADDEQPESPGRRSDPERADLQLNPPFHLKASFMLSTLFSCLGL